MLLGGVRYGAADTPSDEADRRFLRDRRRAAGALGIPRYEISNFARPGLRVAPQFEILAARALRRLRRRRAFLRRPHALAEPESPEEYVAGRAAASRRTPPPIRRALLRRAAADARHPPRRPTSGAVSTRPSTAFWMPACSKRDGDTCASPTAAFCSPTKSSRSS